VKGFDGLGLDLPSVFVTVSTIFFFEFLKGSAMRAFSKVYTKLILKL